MALTNRARNSIHGMAAGAARGGKAAEAVKVTAEVVRVTGGILLPEMTGSPGDLALARNRHRREGAGGDEGMPQ
jgi:hypothetical protein